MRQPFALAALIVLAGCNKMQPTPASTATPNPFDQFDNSTNAVDAPTPNYSEREGDRYFYVSAVSDDDKKKGIAVGEVLQYRYLGVIDGSITIQQVLDNGTPLTRFECKSPCRVMKVTSGTSVNRMAYNPESVVGSAMQDALNGFLEPAKGVKISDDTPLTTLPKSFVGTWNTDLADCGTGNNDSELMVTPGVIRFYESNATVERVTVSGHTATVSAKLTSDEGADENTIIKMTLGADGDTLTMGDMVRNRCPR